MNSIQRITRALLVLCPATLGAQTIEWRNGHWFDGTRFVQRTAYTSGATFAARPVRVDSIVDLAGGFIVPAFGEAHNHGFDTNARFADQLSTFVREGALYTIVQTNFTSTRPDSLRAAQHGVDILYTNGGLTSRFGHSVDLYGRLVRNNVYAGYPLDRLPNDGYYVAETSSDLERVWPALLAGRPDLIKVFLEFSDEHDARLLDSTRYFGHVGLNPALLADVVRRARAADLRVSAHVETAQDFGVAVAGGVDLIAHLPGYTIPRGADPSRYALTDAQAVAAARANVTVITTVSLAQAFHGRDSAQRAIVLGNHRQNIERLKRAGVRLAAGSDSYGNTSQREIMLLRTLGVFSDLELLRMWSVATPQAILPKRKVGELRDGFEANFLVLDANPLEDFTSTTRIRSRVKLGKSLE